VIVAKRLPRLGKTAGVAEETPTAPPRRRLEGVDGLRAVAALWVVGFHVHAFSHVHFPAWTGFDLLLRSGSTGVSLFLVVSGFCLYLPFAAGRVDRFRSGEFLKRRVGRLMPAYYVGLALSAMLTATALQLKASPLSWGDIGSGLVAHLLLLQMLFPTTFYSLNGAYWSLGLEWQIYLTLPILILGVRRFGLTRTLFAVLLLNVAYRSSLWAIDGRLLAHDSPFLTYLLPNQMPGRLAEFGFGMMVAEIYESGQAKAVAKRLWPALIPLVPASILFVGSPFSHILFGAVFTLVLLLVLSPGNFVNRVFSLPPLVAVGMLSYSLFLVHQPLIEYTATFMLAHGAGHWLTFFGLILLLPVIFALAWILFVTIERRSLGTHGSSGDHRLDRILYFELKRPRSQMEPLSE
jgi:peptidoglycan/LPS O-acetylase OafA/YrhL